MPDHMRVDCFGRMKVPPVPVPLPSPKVGTKVAALEPIQRGSCAVLLKTSTGVSRVHDSIEGPEFVVPHMTGSGIGQGF